MAKLIRFDMQIKLRKERKVISTLEAVGVIENKVVRMDHVFKGQCDIEIELKATGGEPYIENRVMDEIQKHHYNG